MTIENGLLTPLEDKYLLFLCLLLQFQRQSTEGVSYTMFTLAMLGNGTYGLSVIVVLPALKDSKRTFVIKHLAWLISCMGVLVLDGFVSLGSVREYLLSW